MKSSGRGMLCESVINKSKEFLGTEINTRELRLYPYLDYVWKNGGSIEFSKINKEEEDIINARISEGHMVMNGLKICPTKKFYDYVQDILADAYVKLAED